MPGRFQTTRWTLIRRARGESAEASLALSELCKIYWYPLYAFVRRKGHSADDAADLTQAFFARLLEKRDLDAVDPKFGRFQSWMLASMTHFLANEWDRASAQKRGGGTVPVPIDGVQADRAWREETTLTLSPERLYERKMTFALFARVRAVLEAEYSAQGNGELYALLKGKLTDEAIGPYAEIAAALEKTEGAVKQHVGRLKERYTSALLEEVEHLVDGSPEEVKAELARMLRSLTDDP